MKLHKILSELEDIKCELWEYVEEVNTKAEQKAKDTMNELLDCIDTLIIEKQDN